MDGTLTSILDDIAVPSIKTSWDGRGQSLSVPVGDRGIELGDSVDTGVEQQTEPAPKKQLTFTQFALLLLGPAAVLAIVALAWWWITCEEGEDCGRVVLGLALLATAFISFFATISGAIGFLGSFRARRQDPLRERRAGIATMVIGAAVFFVSLYVLFFLLLIGIGDNPAEELSLIASQIHTD